MKEMTSWYVGAGNSLLFKAFFRCKIGTCSTGLLPTSIEEIPGHSLEYLDLLSSPKCLDTNDKVRLRKCEDFPRFRQYSTIDLARGVMWYDPDCNTQTWNAIP